MPRQMPTIRRLLVAGVVLGVPYGLAARSYHLRTIAERHEREAARDAAAAKAMSGDAEARPTLERARWHEAMATKYRRASLRPIVDYGPDPPEPE